VLRPGDAAGAAGGFGGGPPDACVDCSPPTACRVETEPCTLASDCCSGLCAADATGAHRCELLSACTTTAGQTCARQVGEPCDAEHRCCSGRCEASPDGGARCAYAGGCHVECEICADAASCCSGRCEADSSGVKRCTAPVGAACLAEGELCSESDDCCPAGAGAVCGKLNASGSPKRCHDSSEDRADGAPCVLSIQCGGGFCIPSATGELVCASECSGERDPCTTASDCCAPAWHDCVPIGGSPMCVSKAG
jgi:hypothetical protein